MDKIDAPLLPITHPIFPAGTSSTDRISSSRAALSAMRLAAKIKSLLYQCLVKISLVLP